MDNKENIVLKDISTPENFFENSNEPIIEELEIDECINRCKKYICENPKCVSYAYKKKMFCPLCGEPIRTIKDCEQSKYFGV